VGDVGCGFGAFEAPEEFEELRLSKPLFTATKTAPITITIATTASMAFLWDLFGELATTCMNLPVGFVDKQVYNHKIGGLTVFTCRVFYYLLDYEKRKIGTIFVMDTF
jgi:hypothetical protein